jgi:alkylated DNA repair dioxygenase AlkB
MKQILNNKISIDYNINDLLSIFEQSINYSNKLKSRSTTNYGKVYQYNGVSYIETDYDNTPDIIKLIGNQTIQYLKSELNIDMNVNNCLVNIYKDGNQSMGYHSDDTEQLENNTGVLIVSLGDERTIEFRPKGLVSTTEEYTLISNSIFYMDKQCQLDYEHCIPKSKTTEIRISLTFRQLK